MDQHLGVCRRQNANTEELNFWFHQYRSLFNEKCVEIAETVGVVTRNIHCVRGLGKEMGENEKETPPQTKTCSRIPNFS